MAADRTAVGYDMSELRSLTSARGVAAWLVVFYHIRNSIAGLPTSALHFFDKGYLAVDFFFLLSGFVIWLSWGSRFQEQGLRIVPQFLKKRIARIWPLHAFVLGGAIVFVGALAVTGRSSPEAYPLGELPLHIMLMQNWGFTAALSWNDPAWSISSELAAYLLFPLLAVTIDWRRVPSWAVLATIAALFVLLHATMSGLGADNLGSDITRLGLIRCVMEFSAGTAVCALWLRWRDVPPVPATIAALMAAGLLGLGVMGAPETLAIPAAFAAILLLLALTSDHPRNPLESRALHWLGEISYAT
ncbi:MAG TPA: acyltransferase, partial [Sphingomicrobium sp.]